MNEDKSAPAENQEPTNEEPAEPVSMDEVIEKEAEAELDQERGEDGKEESDNDGKSDESEQDSDDDSDAEAEGEESDEETDEEEPEDVEEEEQQPEIDTSKFSEVGLEAVPDDYKPKDWKSFLADAVDVIRGEVAKESRAANEQQQAFQQEVSKVDEGWQQEITELQKAGNLPKDAKELEKETKEIFQFMAETNQKNANNPNKQIWSFETAYKLKNAGKVTDERKDEIARRRKARAGAAGGNSNSDGGKGTPSLRPGMSMDDIIAQELNL